MFRTAWAELAVKNLKFNTFINVTLVKARIFYLASILVELCLLVHISGISASLSIFFLPWNTQISECSRYSMFYGVLFYICASWSLLWKHAALHKWICQVFNYIDCISIHFIHSYWKLTAMDNVGIFITNTNIENREKDKKVAKLASIIWKWCVQIKLVNIAELD